MLRLREGSSVIKDFRPLYALRHGEGDSEKGHYWVLRRDGRTAVTCPGHENRISLVDSDSNPLAIESSSLSIMLTCTNRDLPSKLGYGQADGDFVATALAGGCPIRFMRRPSQPFRFDAAKGSQWRLLSLLTLSHHGLSGLGLQGFREMLALHDMQQSPVSQRQIAGIVDLSVAQASTWLRTSRGGSLVHGIALRITLDEEAFVGSGMNMFVQVLDHFLELYVQLNSFIELVVISMNTGEELIRCKPRNGSMKAALSSV